MFPCRKLIEVVLPLKATNEASAREEHELYLPIRTTSARGKGCSTAGP